MRIRKVRSFTDRSTELWTERSKNRKMSMDIGGQCFTIDVSYSDNCTA
jgi:hypothetical protein